MTMTSEPLSKEFVIKRVLDAPRELVWRAFTQAEHLKHWWGPKGFKVLTCTMDFRPGGVFHYGLLSPNGGEVWGKWTFREIVAPERFTMVAAFSDKDGGLSRHPYAPEWPREMLGTQTFEEQGNKTLLTTRSAAFNASEAERKVFEAGFGSMEAGYGGTWDQLAAYLQTIK